MTRVESPSEHEIDPSLPPEVQAFLLANPNLPELANKHLIIGELLTKYFSLRETTPPEAALEEGIFTPFRTIELVTPGKPIGDEAREASLAAKVTVAVAVIGHEVTQLGDTDPALKARLEKRSEITQGALARFKADMVQKAAVTTPTPPPTGRPYRHHRPNVDVAGVGSRFGDQVKAASNRRGRHAA